MGDYFYRAFNSALSSELLPTSLRMSIMRAAGFDIGEEVTIWPNASFRSRRFTIGRNVFINVGFFFDGCAHLTIGDNVRIGQFVRVITGTHEQGSSKQRCLVEVVAKPVAIESGCWIGVGAVILPGVVVRSGCGIAPYSVVTRSTEANGLYAGNRAERARDLPP